MDWGEAESEQRKAPMVSGHFANILRFLYFGCADSHQESQDGPCEQESEQTGRKQTPQQSQARPIEPSAGGLGKDTELLPNGLRPAGKAAVEQSEVMKLQRMEEQLAQALAAQRLSEMKAQTLEEDLKKIAAERNSLKSALDANANGTASTVSPSSGIPTPDQQPATGKGVSWASLGPSMFVQRGEQSNSTHSSHDQFGSARSSPMKGSAQSSATSPFSSFVPSPAPSDGHSVTSLGRRPLRQSREGAEMVEVVVYSASGLLGSGLKDMYVSMKLGDYRCSTPARSPSPTAAEGGSLVTWGQTFLIPHFQPLRSLSLRLRLYAKKGLGRKHVVGEAHIHLRDLIDAPNNRLHQTWPLSGVVGQVELKLAQLEQSAQSSRQHV